MPGVSRPSWSGAAVRVLVGVVLVAVVAVVIVWERRVAPAPAAPPAGVHEPLVMTAAAPDPASGAIALSWKADPRADGYEVELLDSTLSVLATLGPVRTPGLMLEPAAVPAAAHGASAWCRVVAMRGGTRLAESAKLATTLP